MSKTADTQQTTHTIYLLKSFELAQTFTRIDILSVISSESVQPKQSSAVLWILCLYKASDLKSSIFVKKKTCVRDIKLYLLV